MTGAYRARPPAGGLVDDFGVRRALGMKLGYRCRPRRGHIAAAQRIGVRHCRQSPSINDFARHFLETQVQVKLLLPLIIEAGVGGE